MNNQSLDNQQLESIIKYLNYKGPLFIRSPSNFEPNLQRGGSLAVAQDTF